MSATAIHRILWPTDFSDFSSPAMDHAAALARWYDAEITALHVFHLRLPALENFPYPAPMPGDDAERRLLELLSQAVEPIEAAGLRVRIALRHGDPSTEILAMAAESQADIAVLGTHGRQGFDRWVLGSVAEKVLRKAACPVLTVPRDARAPAPRGRPPFDRILCALDLEGTCATTLGYALSLAREAQAGLTLLHVLEGLPDDSLRAHLRLAATSVAEYVRTMEATARDRLRLAVPEDLRRTHRVEEIVVEGRAYKQILRIAEERAHDLIVLGTHGANPIDPRFFGSTAHHVVREARCPVLTIRPPRTSEGAS